jgi:ribosome-binding protein aMBF1 (putative translation factor)|tara:strand:- start:660 stop:866 length:207 start_codon:yes stop_codon:yes gene_type:complete
MITPKPLQLARPEYSIEEEDLFRRELENTINEIASVLSAMEAGKSSQSNSSVRKIFFELPVVGKVTVG